MNTPAVFFAVTLIGISAAQAQMPAAHIAESKQHFAVVRDNLQKAAESMPEANYSFRPTPEIRTFGELVAHIADAQAFICGAASGKSKPLNAGKMTAKAELVAALKESSAACDAAFDGLTEATAFEPVSMGSLKGSRLGVLEYNIGHSGEEYGYLSVYLRLKGIVPPSSANQGGRGR